MNEQKRIEKGIALLDKAAPDWQWRVKPGSIDMRNSETCVLGQLFGNYWVGLEKIGLTRSEKESYNNGFMDWSGFIHQWIWDSGLIDFLEGKGKLTVAWRKAVLDRRKLDCDSHAMEVLEKKGAHV